MEDEQPSELEREIAEEIAEGTDPRHPLRRWLEARRAWVHEHPWFRLAYLTLVAVLGSVVVLVGVVLIPLPGPGWLIVFLGLAILGTEFHWARKLTGWVRQQLARFWAWWRARRSQTES